MKNKIYRSRKHSPGEPPTPLPPEVEYFALCSLRKMLLYYRAMRKVKLVEQRMEEILADIDLQHLGLQLPY